MIRKKFDIARAILADKNISHLTDEQLFSLEDDDSFFELIDSLPDLPEEFEKRELYEV